MNVGELRRLLKSMGASFKEGKRHTKVYINGKQTTLPRHAGKDLGNGFVNDLFKQLGLRKPPR